MPITPAHLERIMADAEVQHQLGSSRIVDGNQVLICNAIKGIAGLSLADDQIAGLEVSFSLGQTPGPAGNEYSRPGVVTGPGSPMRGRISNQFLNSSVTSAQLTTINSDASVIKALERSEITSFELERISKAILDAAVKLDAAYRLADVEALFFSIGLDCAVRGNLRGTCTSPDCPKPVVKDGR